MENKRKILDFEVLSLDNEDDIKLLIQLNEGNEAVVKMFTPNNKNEILLENLGKEFNGKLIDNKDVQYIILPITKGVEENSYSCEKLKLRFSINNGIIDDVALEGKVVSIEKTLLSQNANYLPSEIDSTQKYDYTAALDEKSIVSNNQPPIIQKISEDIPKTKTDLHNHYAGMLSPNRLIALGIKHNVDYNLGLITNLDLKLTAEQKSAILEQLAGKNAKIYEKLAKYEDTNKAFEILTKNIKKENIHSKDILEGITIPFIDLIKEDNNRENLNKIKDSLRIGPNGQKTFTNLEYVYDARDPFTKGNGNGQFDKNPVNEKSFEKMSRTITGLPIEIREMVEESFKTEYGGIDFSKNRLQEDQMLWIAREAQENGVKYIETSQAVFTKGGKKSEEFINIVNNIMPKIEEATGTKIRFLAAMRRNMEDNTISKQEQYKQTVENMIQSAKDCPYVVGCDFMGEELNETAHFSEALTNIARYTKQVDPNFVIRVHAGENDSFSKNVAQVLDCVEAVYGKDGKYPPIRIGHGLYGSDENTKEGRKLLERMKKMGVTVEFNLTSNVKLNNITDIKKCPLKTYLQYGIPVVLGTDGGGIYGTNVREEQEIVMGYIGLTGKELESIIKTENRFMMFDKIRERLRQDPERVKKKEERTSRFKYAENIAENKELPQERTKNARRLQKSITNSKKEKEIPEDKIPIIIAGGSFNQDGKNNEVLAKDVQRLRKIIELADPEKYSFVIGHSFQGQEGKLLKLLKHSNKKFDVTVISPEHLDHNLENKMSDSMITRIIEVSNDRGAGIYKGFDKTIFSQNRKALLYAFEGDAPLSNLITEGNKDSNLKIRYNAKEEILAEKAQALGVKARDDRATIKPFNISSQVNVFGKDGKIAQLRNEAKEFGGRLFEKAKNVTKELLEGIGER